MRTRICKCEYAYTNASTDIITAIIHFWSKLTQKIEPRSFAYIYVLIKPRTLVVGEEAACESTEYHYTCVYACIHVLIVPRSLFVGEEAARESTEYVRRWIDRKHVPASKRTFREHDPLQKNLS